MMVTTQATSHATSVKDQNPNYFNHVGLAQSDRCRLHNTRNSGEIPATRRVFFLRPLTCLYGNTLCTLAFLQSVPGEMIWFLIWDFEGIGFWPEKSSHFNHPSLHPWLSSSREKVGFPAVYFEAISSLWDIKNSTFYARKGRGGRSSLRNLRVRGVATSALTQLIVQLKLKITVRTQLTDSPTNSRKLDVCPQLDQPFRDAVKMMMMNKLYLSQGADVEALLRIKIIDYIVAHSVPPINADVFIDF